MVSPRRCRAEDSPSTQRTASMTLDLPHPLGPTTPTSCPGSGMWVGSTKDLKPASLMWVRRNWRYRQEKVVVIDQAQQARHRRLAAWRLILPTLAAEGMPRRMPFQCATPGAAIIFEPVDKTSAWTGSHRRSGILTESLAG